MSLTVVWGLASHTETNNFNVTFEFSKMGIIDKCLDISIQNLKDETSDFELRTILNETNFNTNQLSNMKFSEYISEEVLFNITNTTCAIYNETTANGTVEHSNCTTEVVGNYTKEIWSWKAHALFKEDSEGKNELRNKWENQHLGKAGGSKDTKYYRLCYSTPMIKSNGWGNKGTFYLDLSGEVFWDKTNSSWWNTTFTKTRQISNLTGNFSYMNLTYDSDMQADFDDLRFTNTANDTEFNFTIEDKVNSDWVAVRVHNKGDSSIQMYYGNADVTTTSSASDTYFNPVSMYYLDEASGTNFYDEIGGDGNATLQGTMTVGQSGLLGYSVQSANADSTANYISIPAAVLNGKTTFSINFWYKETANTRAIVDPGLFAVFWGGGDNIYSLIRDDNKLVSSFSNGAHNEGDASITTNLGWNMFTLSYDGTTVKYYINNVNIHNKTVSLTYPNYELRIGAWIYHSFKDGYIDEIGIWSKGLNLNQIIQLYTQNEPSYVLGAEETADTCTCPGLTSNWEIDLSDHCNITTNCNISTGNITFINAGYVFFNATLTMNKIDFKDSVGVAERYNVGSNFRGWIG